VNGPGGPDAVDPDVDLGVPYQRTEVSGRHGLLVLAVISAGGVLGALARYGIGSARPAGPDGFPWATLLINVAGSALIGVLMALVAEGGRAARGAHPLVRPFLGVGVLGGFTTFSAYALEAYALLERGRVAAAAGYAAGTLFGGLVAVWLGAVLARRAVR
jgi:fluoride exporter